MPNKYDVFITFSDTVIPGESNSDRRIAEQLQSMLVSEGLNVFYSKSDLSEAELADQKNKALEESGLLIVVSTTPENVRSKRVKSEWTRFLGAVNSGRKPDGKIMTVLSGMTTRSLPLELSNFQSFDASDLDAAVVYAFRTLGRISNSAARKQSGKENAGGQKETDQIKLREMKAQMESERRIRNKTPEKAGIKTVLSKKLIGWIIGGSSAVLALVVIGIAAALSAFAGDEWKYNVLSDGTVEITDYFGQESEIIIPDRIGIRQVSAIGKKAFISSSATSIRIPDGVKTINESAFENCDGLKTLTIPDSVITINGSAFRECDLLESVVLGNGVTTVGEYAFRGCDRLQSVTMGKKVTSIDNYAFERCGSLSMIEIPDGVTSIGDSAFACCYNLASFMIPDQTVRIGDSAFAYCYGLTSVTIPQGVVSVGDYAFYGCNGLTSVEMESGTAMVGSGAFGNCSSLSSVTLSDSVSNIGQKAFINCVSLSSVTLPDSVKMIGKYAFYGCSGITSFTMGSGVNTVGDCAFFDCRNMQTLTFGEEITTIGERAFFNCRRLSSVTIPKNVTSIGSYAFCDCDSLTSVTVPSKVTEIGDKAFLSCDNLTEIIVKTSNKNYRAVKGVLMNRAKTEILAYPCGKEGEYEISSSVSAIAGGAFCDCSELTAITIPDGMVSIGDSAFQNCVSLSSVTLPDSVQTVGRNAFSNCTGIESVTIGSGVTSVGGNAFKNCSGLISVTLGEGVQEIGDNAFFRCGSLTEIQVASLNEAFCSVGGVLLNKSKTELIAFPQGKTGAYSIPLSVTDIRKEAFFDSSLTSVTVTDSVASVGAKAFWNCDSLTSLTLGGSVKVISDLAFSGCVNLTSLTIPDSVTYISETAFNGCENLTVTASHPASYYGCGNGSFKDWMVP